MKKIYSLKNKREFELTLRKGKKIFTKTFSVYYLPSNKFEIGISVPKKNGNAVYRNKNKRRIKNILNNPTLYKDLNFKVIIILKKEFDSTTFFEIEKDILRTLEKIQKNGK